MMTMTTQELKQQIDKVLGNSIRCLLPSYWWKRLFNQVADRIEDKQDILVSGKNIKTVNGKDLLGEGDTNADIIINSVDGLNALGLPAGSRASVVTGGPVLGSIKDCVESDDETQWTRVSGVQINAFPDFSLLSADDKEIAIYLYEGTSPAIYIIAQTDEEGSFMAAVRMGTSEAIYLSWNGVDISQDGVDRLNEWLKTGEYKVSVFDGFHDESDFFDSFIKFYIYHPTFSDVYVKADSWERLAKESDIEAGGGITIDSELSDTSENPVQNKAVKAYVDESTLICRLYAPSDSLPLTDDLIAKNRKSYEEFYTKVSENAPVRAVVYFVSQLNGTSASVGSPYEVTKIYADVEYVGSQMNFLLCADFPLFDYLNNASIHYRVNVSADGLATVQKYLTDTSDLATKVELEEVEEVVASAMSHTSKKIDDLEAYVKPNLLTHLELDIDKSTGAYVLKFGGGDAEEIGNIYYCSVTVKGLENDLISSGVAKGSEVLLFVLGGILNIDCIDHMGINKDGNVSHATYRISIKRSTSEDIIETATGFSTETIYTDKVTRKILAENLFTDEIIYEKEFVLADANI